MIKVSVNEGKKIKKQIEKQEPQHGVATYTNKFLKKKF